VGRIEKMAGLKRSHGFERSEKSHFAGIRAEAFSRFKLFMQNAAVCSRGGRLVRDAERFEVHRQVVPRPVRRCAGAFVNRWLTLPNLPFCELRASHRGPSRWAHLFRQRSSYIDRPRNGD